MTVKELVEFLNRYSPDMPVMVQGYEGGFQDVLEENITTQDIVENYRRRECFYGPHESLEVVQDMDSPDGVPGHKPALILGR
jgi:hypothetical protein